MTYIHERDDWPKFRWQDQALAASIAEVRHRQGRLIGRMEALGFKLREEAVLRTLTEDVIKSSEIEGEELDVDHVRSSIARRLGMDVAGLVPAERDVGLDEVTGDEVEQFRATDDEIGGLVAAALRDPAGEGGCVGHG